MIGIKRYSTAELAIQDLENLEDAQVISLDDEMALYRANKSNNTLEPITDSNLGLFQVGDIKATLSNTVPTDWLPCTGVEYDITRYPKLYAVLQSNKTPDLRECHLEGIGTSGRTEVTNHDPLTLGQFSNDCIRDHYHGVATSSLSDLYPFNTSNVNTNTSGIKGWGSPWGAQFNTAVVTRPKSFGINYLIRAV